LINGLHHTYKSPINPVGVKNENLMLSLDKEAFSSNALTKT